MDGLVFLLLGLDGLDIRLLVGIVIMGYYTSLSLVLILVGLGK